MLHAKLAFIPFHSHAEWSDRTIINLEVYSPDGQELVVFCFISSVLKISLD